MNYKPYPCGMAVYCGDIITRRSGKRQYGHRLSEPFAHLNFPMMKENKRKLWQVSEVKLIYSPKIRMSECPQIKSSKDAADILWVNWSDDLELVETFNVLFMNRASRVKGMLTVSKGGVSGTVVDAKLVFAAALKAMATTIVLAHNHPSGNLNPSQMDITLTEKLVKAGELLDIFVLDHIILTAEGYYSFGDNGQI